MLNRIGLVVLLIAAAAACTPVTVADGGAEESSDDHDTPIVGGKPTKAFPAVGALTLDGFMHCTGTVVAPRVVVTAAHCVVDVSASELAFVLGPKLASPSATIAVTAVRAHPSYDPARIENDIGLLVLAADAPVEPIKILEAMDDSWLGKELVFVGFGVSNGKKQTGDGLKRSVKMAVSEIRPQQFVYAMPKKNTCNGDSGGPAFAQLAGELLLAGITSYGDPSCQEFGVDTRADAYRSFVTAYQQEPCAGETLEGRCDGDSVIWCEDDEIKTIACSSGCAFDDSLGAYDCV